MENIWLYEVLGQAWGVVKALTKEEAEQKVKKAYMKHCNDFDEYIPIVVKSKEEEQGFWFTDCPDVLEVYG